jgi:signal transduction histidine kinase
LLGFAASIVTFVLLVTLVSVGLSLLITLVGIPILLATAYVNRWLADVERWRAGFLLRRQVGRSYRDASGRGFWHRARVVATDPQTWKDYGWLALLTVIGFSFGVGAITFWAIALSMVSVPIWWWIPPDPVFDVAIGSHAWSVDSWPRALLIGALGVVATVLTAWICAALARGQALAARFFLEPGAQERVEALERSRAAVVRAEEQERRRLERDIHDGVQARLVALALDLGMARDKLDGGDTVSARVLVDEAHDEAKQTLATLRELVRGVHPAILSDRGLDAALSALAASSPVPVELDVEVERLPDEVEAAAYFVAAEALANVAKHSRATRCDVRVRLRDQKLVVEISDDGVGGARVGVGSGLAGLADRVEALDGVLRVASPQGGPTVVVVEIPCAS